jgi:choline dehydrogenase-like flavoprotein
VQRVVWEGDRAVGVRGRFQHPVSGQRGAAFRVRARAVLLAASVTHTAVLLRRSGVRGKVGHGFRAHPGTAVIGLYDQAVDMNRGATQGWASLRFRDDPGVKLETLALPLDMAASRLPGGGTEFMARLRDYRQAAMWVHVVRAESVGRIHNVFGYPVVRYDLTKADLERVRAGVHLVARQHVAAGARAILPGVYGVPSILAPNEVDRLRDAPLDPRSYTAILSHLFGGATMGRDPAQSVVDGRGKVHGVQNLWVVDASVIPSNLGVNPQHTIMALARTFARALAEAGRPAA